MVLTPEEIKERLQGIMNRVANEIRDHGAETLYHSGQWVTGAKITVEIDHNMFPKVTYEHSVYPK